MMPTERRQPPYRHPIAGDDETVPIIEFPHDLTALVAQLSLGDLSNHILIVARRATMRIAADDDEESQGSR